MKLFQKNSLFDLFIKSEKKDEVLVSLKSYLQILKNFFIFFLVFSFIPILFFFLAKGISTKYFLDFEENYYGKIEFIETSKIGTSTTNIPGATNLLSLNGSLGSSNGGEENLLSRILYSEEVVLQALFSQAEPSSELIINDITKEFFPQSKVHFNKFDSIPNIDSLTMDQMVVFKKIRGILESTNNDFYSYKSGVTRTIQIKSSNENLSLSLPVAFFNALENFYESRKTTDRVLTDQLIKDRKNEALATIRKLQNEISESKRKNGLTISPARANYEKELGVQLAFAKQIYAETTRQLENLELASDKDYEPRFKILSKPIAPLGVVTPNNETTLFIHQIIGAILGIILIFFLYLIYQFILFYKNK